MHVQSGCFANLDPLILAVVVDVAVVVAWRSHEVLRNLFLNWRGEGGRAEVIFGSQLNNSFWQLHDSGPNNTIPTVTKTCMA